MTRRLIVLVSLALVAAACAGESGQSAGTSTPVAGAEPPPSTRSSTAPSTSGSEGGGDAQGTTTSTAPTTSGSEGGGDAQGTTTSTTESAPTQTTRPAPDPNRPLAPDFELTISDGSTYRLSEDTKPVFMVFWAEW